MPDLQIFAAPANLGASGRHHSSRGPGSGPPSVQPKAELQFGTLQRAGRKDFEIDPARIGIGNGAGQALPQPLLAKMESAFGADFSAVRIHSGPQAGRIGALAFTMGENIYFAPGQYNPGSHPGQQLLGHELAHVIQQRQGRVRTQAGGVSVVQDIALEAEADRLGSMAAAHRMPAASGASAILRKAAPGSAVIQRHTQLLFANGTLRDPTEKVTGSKHIRNMHSDTHRLLVAYMSGYTDQTAAKNDKCGTCNHYVPYSVVATNVLNKIKAAKDLGTAVTWINGLKLKGSETYHETLWENQKTKWQFQVGAMPQPSIKSTATIGGAKYDDFTVNSEIDDLIINLANDPRNMFYSTTSSGDNGGTTVDVPTAIGKGCQMTLLSLKKRLSDYEVWLTNLLK